MEENNNEKISVSGADLLKDVVADEKAAKTAPKDTEKDKKDKDKKKDKKTDDMVLFYYCQYCNAAAVGLPSYAYNNQIQLV